ncbi:MAG: CHASE domain-containing protein [Gammaproteobacteria bacterium]|nr:CHASE domain-containing protein [Gammaproteobacteria bacterium]
MSAFFTIKGELDSHRQAEFSWEAHNRNNALKKGIEDGLESVKAVRDLFQASEHVTQPEFRYFARALLARYRGIHALEWVSPVRHGFATADKSAEAADAGLVASHGIEFRITYIEPIRHDGQEPGFDYAAEPQYRELMERAWGSGQLTVSGRIRLIQGNGPQYGFIAIQPVYVVGRPVATEEQRREALRGFSVGVFRIADLASAAISRLEPRGVEFLVLDESAEPGQQFLDFYASRLDKHPQATVDYTEAPQWSLREAVRVRQTFPVADRIWSITNAPIDNFRSAEGFANGPNIILAGGGMLTLTMTMFVFYTRASIRVRMKIEQELRESGQKLRVLFDQSPDFILTVDRDDNCLMINRPMPKRYGGEDFQGSAGFFPESVQASYREVLKNVLQSGEADEIQFSGDDPSWWELRIVPLRMAGSVAGAMVIVKDITEKRMLEVHTIRNARLASLGVLAASVAHEINNPNNAIQFNASILSRSWVDILRILKIYRTEHGDFTLGGVPVEQALTGTPRLLESIASSAQRIQTIVANLKHLARPDQGELDHKVDIAEVLRTTLSILQNQIRMLCDDCRMEIAEPLPAVRGNAQQLEQVFINVILNALQSLPQRSAAVRITANLEESGEYIRVTVSDQGIGISEENQSRVLDPFFTTKGEHDGTGLGLSISYRIIQNHQGRMALNSRPGDGTDVIMQLPVYVGAR